MTSIADIRTLYPMYDHLPTRDVLDGIHRQFYSAVEVNDFLGRIDGGREGYYGEAQPRQSPHPETVTPEAERERAQLSMLPPGTDPATIPRSQPGIDPATMPAIASPRRLPQGAEAIHATDDGGVVYRQQGGELGFVGSNFSTVDPDTVMGILRGQHPGTAERGVNNAMIEANPVAARGATAFQGVLGVGSYLDEAASAMFGEDAGRSVLQLQEAMTESRPTESALLRGGGTALSAIPAVAAAAPSAPVVATTRGAQMVSSGLRGALGAATEGAVYGAGDQSGGGRQANALTNAAVGGVLGGAAGAALPLLDRGLSRSLEQFRDSPVDVIQEQFDVSPQAAAIIQRAIRADDPMEALRRIAARGDDAMLADAGAAGAGLLNTAVAEGGAAAVTGRSAVEARVVRQHEALSGVIDDVLGQPVGRDASIRAIREGTAAERQQMYAAAYSQPIDYSAASARRLEGLLSRVPEAAITRANEIMRLNGDESAQIIARIGDDGRPTFETLPDVRQVHLIMQALGDVAQTQDGAGALRGQTTRGSATENVRRGLGNALGDLVPEFSQAQRRYADIATEVRATEAGYNLLRSTRDQVAGALGGASEAELRAARQGVRDYLFDEVDRIAAIASDPNLDARQLREMMSELTSDRARANLQSIMGRSEAGELVGAVDEAMGSLQLRAAIARNSDTHIRGVIRDEVNAQSAPGVLESLVSGLNIRDAGRQMVQVFTGNSAEAQALRSQAMMSEIARALTEIRGPAAQRALRSVQTAMEGQTLTPSQAEMIGAVLSRNAAVLGHQEALQSLEVR